MYSSKGLKGQNKGGGMSMPETNPIKTGNFASFESKSS